MDRQKCIVNNEEESILILDPSVIKEKRQGSKSVTDGFGISVFTDEFHKHMADYEETLNQNSVGRKIFVEIMGKDSGLYLEEILFQEPIVVMESDYDTAKGDLTPIFYYGVVGVMFICFAVFLYRYHIRGEKIHDNYDNPDNGGT